MAMEESNPEEEQVLDPTKLMRITGMVREILDEARRMQPPTKETAEELAKLYRRITKQLEDALPKFLVAELDSMGLDEPFGDGATAEEVRVAFSALIGWLGGLAQGLQASFQAQAAAGQIEQQGGPSLDWGGPNGGNPKKGGYL